MKNPVILWASMIVLCFFVLVPMGIMRGFDEGDGVLSIVNVTAQEHPYCDVCYIVRWETDRPTVSNLEVIQNGSNWSDFQVFPAFYRSKELTIEHEVVVLGLPIMRSSVEYLYRIHSTDEEGVAASARGSFIKSSGDFPNIPEFSVNVYDPEKAYNGWTIFDLQPVVNEDGGGMEESYSGLMMVDMNGRVMWNYPYATVDVEVLENGNLLMLQGPHIGEMTLAGDWVWEIELELEMHHDVDLVWDEDHGHHHVVGILREVRSVEGVEGVEIMQVDAIVELELNGQEVWAWRTLDHPEYIPYDRVDPTRLQRDQRHPAVVDLTHFNSVTLDKERGYCYFYAKYLNAFFKVRYAPGDQWSDGNLDWMLGDFPVFIDEVWGEMSLQPRFLEVINGVIPYWAHEPELRYVDIDGEEVLQVLFFDNNVRGLEHFPMDPFFFKKMKALHNSEEDDFVFPGEEEPEYHSFDFSKRRRYWTDIDLDFLDEEDDDEEDDGFSQITRVVEFQIEEGSESPFGSPGTAEQLWEYNGAEDYYFRSSGQGDVDRLPNGNIFIAPARTEVEYPEEEERGSDVLRGVFMEITPDGEKVWDGWLEDHVGNYKAQRVRDLTQGDNYLNLVTLKNDVQQSKLFEMPGSRDEELGEVVTVDNSILENKEILFMSSGDFNEDSEDDLVFIAKNELMGNPFLLISLTSELENSDIDELMFRLPLDDLFSRYVIRDVSAGNFDQDRQDELVLFLEEKKTKNQGVVVYNVAFDQESGQVSLELFKKKVFWSVKDGKIRFMEAADFGRDLIDKLVVMVERNGDLQLEVHDLFSASVVPERVVNLVGKIGSSLVMVDLTVGDYDGDSRDELLLVYGKRKQRFLEVYELPWESSGKLEKSSEKMLTLMGQNQSIFGLDENLLGITVVERY